MHCGEAGGAAGVRVGTLAKMTAQLLRPGQADEKGLSLISAYPKI